MKYDKIYVLAPVKISTGGVELSHKLVSILRDKGLDAYIVYVDGKKISSSQMVTPAYLKYNIKIASVIDDSKVTCWYSLKSILILCLNIIISNLVFGGCL